MTQNRYSVFFSNSIEKNVFGGGEKWMLSAASGLRSRGHRIIMSGKKGSMFLDRCKRAGLETYESNIRSDFNPFKSLSIAGFLSKNEIDIVICNLNKDVRVAGLAARFSGDPIVIARHGMQLTGKKKKHQFIMTHLVDGIITNSNSVKKVYDDYGWYKNDFVYVLYNGVEIPRSVSPYNYHRQADEFILLTAGRLTRQKGFDVLINAMPAILESHPATRLFIAGEGPLRSELEKQIQSLKLSNNVLLTGQLDSIIPHLAGCDIFVLPSRFEGMPNVVLEAMSVQKPVVATDVNGSAELVLNGQTGILIPADQSDLLSQAVIDLIHNPEKRHGYGKAGFERVQQLFTVERMVDQLENYLGEKRLEARLESR